MTANSPSVCAFFALCLSAGGCAKKTPKPVHTEPWLAHPAASAALGPDAALTVVRYALTEQSQIRFELPSRHGKAQGTLTRVTGELRVSLGALAQSRGQVSAALDSLTLTEDGEDSAALLGRARSALGLSDAGAADRARQATSFEVSSLEDVSPEALEPVTLHTDHAPITRRARATAVGDLLLNGFRVARRASLEVVFRFDSDPTVPSRLLIRSRGPLVVSLETHQIQEHDRDPASHDPARSKDSASAREARVSVELYGKKVERAGPP